MNERIFYETRIYNLSVKNIVTKTITTITDILMEILKLIKSEEIKELSYYNILSKCISIIMIKDRMIYFGIFLIILALLLMIFFIIS